MINFGVREVANSKAATAPGWAYVPDTGVNASVAALQPASRKRARNQTVASSHETTARQDAKILRELAFLDRENAKDVSIPVPIRHRDNAGRGMAAPNKPTWGKLLTVLPNSEPWQSHIQCSKDPPIPKDIRKLSIRFRSARSESLCCSCTPTCLDASKTYPTSSTWHSGTTPHK